MAQSTVVQFSNDRSGQRPTSNLISDGQSGNVTADKTFVHNAPYAGKIVDVPLLSVSERGVDGANPLNMVLDVQINAVSIFTTKPKIDKTAAAGYVSTKATATGITPGVIDTTKNTFAQGDTISVVHDITRTASPGTEVADPTSAVLLRPLQDFDPSA